MKVFFDAETLKTQREDYIERIRKSIKPPGNITKEESKQKWMDENFASAVQEEAEKTVFNGGLCHVVQMQWAIDDGETTVAIAKDVAGEIDVLKRFFAAVSANGQQS